MFSPEKPSWLLQIEELAADREHGAAFIVQKAADIYTEAFQKEIDSHQVKDSLRKLVIGQSKMAPVLRLVSDLWNALEEKNSQSVFDTAKQWSDELSETKEKFLVSISSSNLHKFTGPWIFFSSSSSINDGITRLSEEFGYKSLALVGESIPGGEGEQTAELIASLGWDVTLLPDSVLFDRISGLKNGLAVLGCDSLSEEYFINKSGSGALTSLAHSNNISIEIWTTTHKILPQGIFDLVANQVAEKDGSQNKEEIFRRERPLFGTGKIEHISTLRTELGVLSISDLRDLAQAIPGFSKDIMDVISYPGAG